MRTTLTPERLTALDVEGRRQAAASPFVAPEAAAKSKRLIDERGWEWATSVLRRALNRGRHGYPMLKPGEIETLILAAEAEWEDLQRAAQSPDA
ncbi:hypothetical protein AB0395_34765 [Streptosporangium sp. NPDC051023]|uniref:hypothetical protein n=1 Tax=Streptosporangium sp. NPDC051023 TaxID=3155410 RepID=UPI00344F2BCA